MDFLPFGKIVTASPEGSSADQGAWIAQEKIHGAQLVVGVSATETRAGKRKSWLADGEPFFGWQLLRVEIFRVARAVREALRVERDRTLYLYGELFGGAYPHPDVPPVPGLSAVQTGIWYAPDLRWAPFDAVLAAAGAEAAEFADTGDLATAVRAAGGITPPVLARGRKTDAGATPVRFPTRVPALLGLPRIPDNLAEGIVLKPEGRTPAQARVAVKRKIAELDEARFGLSEAFDPTVPLPLDPLLALAERLTNGPRIASARSKVGEREEAIRDEVVLDVLLDLEAAFPAAMRSLPDDAVDALRARILARLG